MEQLREHPHHDFAVLKHVADTRRRPTVIFQHIELVRTGAHQIDADNVAPDIAGRAYPDHGYFVGIVSRHQMFRNFTCADDFATVIDVGNKRVQRHGPLADAFFKLAPFRGSENAWKHIKGDQALRIAAFSVDSECDAHTAEQGFGFGLLQAAQIVRHIAMPALKALIGLADLGTV